MRAKLAEKEKAIRLRKQGLSYSEIARLVPVSAASLSLWLHSVELTDKQRRRLQGRSLRGQRAGARARRENRLAESEKIKQLVQQNLPARVNDSFFMTGLALYWAEGSKQKPWNVSASVAFGNLDEQAVLLMREWFKEYFDVSENRLGYRLHIHKTADVKRARRVWAQILDIDAEKLSITIKQNNSKFLRNRNRGQYKGLVTIKVYKSVQLNREIDAYTKLAAKHFLKNT